MTRESARWTGLALTCSAGVLVAAMLGAQAPSAVAVDANDIGGVVRSARGVEAGVWVIAKTTGLPTGFRKIVVTDEQGRFVVPDLPKAAYDLWVRGYGLVDSPRVNASPGSRVALSAVVAPDARAAAQVYPAVYWFSMLQVPPASEFSGAREGFGAGMKSQAHWVNHMKSGCMACHQVGTRATREVPKHFADTGSTDEQWEARVRVSQVGGGMANSLAAFGRPRGVRMFAAWTDRIAAGSVPEAPPRPQGIERQVVISQWDWADALSFVHDVTATDRRNPTRNPYGIVYGNDRLNEPNVITLDPVKHVVTKSISVPIRDADTPFWMAQKVGGPSAYWGHEIVWKGKSNMHNQMFDAVGRVWMTSTIRAGRNPAFCQAGSTHPSAVTFPLAASGRQATVYNPKTGKTTMIDLCFGTHHLIFAEDADNTLWFSGGGNVIGWLNTKRFDESGDAQAAQGWSPFVLDTNGNGVRDGYTEPNQPADPSRDRRIGGRDGGAESGFALGLYGIAFNPVDRSIWGAIVDVPGRVIRFDPRTGLSETYEPPFEDARAAVQGYTPRGLDIDRNGVVWTGLASGHLASFDRRRCKVLNGPTATGRHCPEGWTLRQTPGPTLAGTLPGSADFHYYNWVDQFDTFGLGKDTPFVNGTNSDSLAALRPDGSFMVIRVPYPLGYYSRGLDGRIDDVKGGWKGKGLWTAYSSQAPWHVEGGKGATSKIMQIQLRPAPLAK
jgi:hypothetical protein